MVHRPLQDGLLSPAISINSNDELRLEDEGGHLIPLNLNWRPSPYQQLGQGVSDPFQPMPPSLDPRMSKHLYYYVNIMMSDMHPSYSTNMVRKTFGCKAWVWSDELTMSPISAFSATSRALFSGDLRRHDQGLGGQNPGFHDAGISDLILLETFTGNIADATAHMGGLSRIAALRAKGGPLPYSIAAKVTAADIKLATLSSRKTIAPFTLFPKISLPLPSISHLLPDLAHSLIAMWPKISDNSSIVELFHDLASQTRHTEAVYRWIYPYTETDAYYEYINDHNLWIEHRLLSYTSSNMREECVRVACILYCNIALIRGYPMEAALVHNTLVVLKRALENYEEGWKGVEEVRLWVLLIGAYASRGQEDEGFFVIAFR
ncbi:hypothetical protein BDV96DRAFT_641538 [Lophiotrema nucula]|uniref:Uncharacterized protein n=1 Tax=Lophiotrema nucula TaxID=690887 RepID=A0A6A5ZNS9_9PLEO|nr:hypothetical protein BDV96DRAFT_641538 [Lophiotrema nucula]